MFQEYLDRVVELVKAHPNLQPIEYARMVQQQFRDQPALGMLLLAWAADKGELPEETDRRE